MVKMYVETMMQLLLIVMLHWANPKNFNPDSFSDNCSMVYFVEIDLGYPDDLHDLHSDSSLAPGKDESSKRNPV